MPEVQLTTRDVPLIQVSAFAGAHLSVGQRLAGVLGHPVPEKQSTLPANSAAPVFCVGPGRWWIVSGKPDCGEIIARLPASEAGVVDLSAARCVVGLVHPRSRDILAKGCGMDFDRGVFPPGAHATTRLARFNVLLHALGDGTGFDIYVPRSFTDALLRWLSDASVEFSQ